MFKEKHLVLPKFVFHRAAFGHTMEWPRARSKDLRWWSTGDCQSVAACRRSVALASEIGTALARLCLLIRVGRGLARAGAAVCSCVVVC